MMGERNGVSVGDEKGAQRFFCMLSAAFIISKVEEKTSQAKYGLI